MTKKTKLPFSMMPASWGLKGKSRAIAEAEYYYEGEELEKVLDEISFTATDRSGEKITINSDYVKNNLGELVKDTDLSKFIL